MKPMITNQNVYALSKLFLMNDIIVKIAQKDHLEV